MTYSRLIAEFAGLPVADYENAKSWRGTTTAYRLREEYDDKVSIGDRLKSLLAERESDQLTALIIGAWTGACEGDGAEVAIARLVEAAPQLPHLRALFLGEMTYEECEISWIKQSDVSPLLRAFPRLEILRIRGGSDLSFSPVRHERLRELAVESGGLSQSTLRELFLCDLPSLERLELLLGEPNYGFDGSVEDLQPLLSGRFYPRLKHLGLMNSEIADELAEVVVNSPIVERIETLDLSMGNLSDEGVRSLHELAEHKNLKRLDISHHYAAEEEVRALQNVLSCEIVADDPQDADDEWRPILHAE